MTRRYPTTILPDMTEQGAPQGLQGLITRLEQERTIDGENQRREQELAVARRVLVERADGVLITKGIPFGHPVVIYVRNAVDKPRRSVLLLRTTDVETEGPKTSAILSLRQRIFKDAALLDGFHLSLKTNNVSTTFSVGNYVNRGEEPIGIDEVPVIGDLIDFIDSQLPAIEVAPQLPDQV